MSTPSLKCHYCRQPIVGQPYYYYRDSRQQENDKVPFCSTLCIQEWKGNGYRHYNIVNYDAILQQRRKHDDSDGDIRT
jgi:hypothetical protein